MADDPREQAADAFAAEWLTSRAYDATIKGKRCADESKELAAQMDVTPGLGVDR